MFVRLCEMAKGIVVNKAPKCTSNKLNHLLLSLWPPHQSQTWYIRYERNWFIRLILLLLTIFITFKQIKNKHCRQFSLQDHTHSVWNWNLVYLFVLIDCCEYNTIIQIKHPVAGRGKYNTFSCYLLGFFCLLTYKRSAWQEVRRCRAALSDRSYR